VQIIIYCFSFVLFDIFSYVFGSINQIGWRICCATCMHRPINHGLSTPRYRLNTQKDLAQKLESQPLFWG